MAEQASSSWKDSPEPCPAMHLLWRSSRARDYDVCVCVQRGLTFSLHMVTAHMGTQNEVGTRLPSSRNCSYHWFHDLAQKYKALPRESRRMGAIYTYTTNIQY